MLITVKCGSSSVEIATLNKLTIDHDKGVFTVRGSDGRILFVTDGPVEGIEVTRFKQPDYREYVVIDDPVEPEPNRTCETCLYATRSERSHPCCDCHFPGFTKWQPRT